MKYVGIIFESSQYCTLSYFSQKCHSLDSDINKFLLARVDSNNELMFLNKNKIFMPECLLDQLMFDNRFTLFDNRYQAELELKNIQSRNENEMASFFIYSVAKEAHDYITLRITK